MTDYRKPEHRREYFDALYRFNLEHRVMPGLVYLYMPELARREGWGAEERLWFAFLNGLTQNPITSLRLMQRLPQVPPAGAALTSFAEWFNAEWGALQFDTDRLKNKKNTVRAIQSYADLVKIAGSQQSLYQSKSYLECWKNASDVYSFGRLSAFSYLEYVHLNGFGADCDDLMFEDKSGSRSHRNGMLLLHGRDDLVWDKRQPNSHDGQYVNFPGMCLWLREQADQHLQEFRAEHPELTDAGRFTLESNLCTFKNHFYARRYPGVYADMAWERIVWAEERGLSQHTRVFREIRAERLPEWLRMECEPTNSPPLRQRAAVFPETGRPYRGEHFL